MSVYVTDEVKELQGRVKFVCNNLIELSFTHVYGTLCRRLATLLASCTTPDHFTVEPHLLNGCCAHDTALFNYFKDFNLNFNK